MDSKRLLQGIVESERVKHINKGGKTYSTYKFLEEHCGITRKSRAIVERTGVISPILMQRLLNHPSIKEKLTSLGIVVEIKEDVLLDFF